MIKKLLPLATLGLISVLSSQQAAAHVHYIDLQADMGIQEPPTANVDGSTTYDFKWVVKGNGAWANATDANWADSHSIPWFKFDIANSGGAYIDLSVAGGLTEFSGLHTLGDLTPAFSLYQGLLPGAAHDGATPIPGKEGMWNALGDTTMGNGPGPIYDYSGVTYDPVTGEQIGEPVLVSNDPGEVKTIHYLTHAGFVDSTATSVSLEHFYLDAGSYTVALGGTCYECYPHYERFDPESPFYDPSYGDLIISIENDAQSLRGVTLDLTVHPVPVPSAIWLMASGLLGLFRLGTRQTRS